MRAILLFCLMLLVLSSSACKGSGDSSEPDYRQEMRDFVRSISGYAKGISPGFVVIPQNGQELMTTDGESDGALDQPYVNAIDGIGREDLFYGYEADNVPTPASERAYMIGFLDRAEAAGLEVLVIDYCWTAAYVDDSYTASAARSYISFAADRRELDSIPAYPASPYNGDNADISTLSDAKNFLYLINTDAYGTKAAFLTALQNTIFDLLLIDPFFEGSEALTPGEVSSLKTKSGGGSRLVIAYMSIGEAEDYRYYWKSEWATNPPEWLEEENPDWPGNYKVRYWQEGWQALIFGGQDSYLKKILDAGFDGVYLDIVDGFEYFEERKSGSEYLVWIDSLAAGRIESWTR